MSRRAVLVSALILIGVTGINGCNVPTAVQGPQLSNEEIASTAVARVLAAQTAAAPQAAAVPAAEELAAPAATAVPTDCPPHVIAKTNANVRSGDSTDYGVVGALPTGATAPVAGRNADSTWWYIQFAGGFGGYAWIAGSVVDTACIPAAVQVVYAPPLPTAPPTEVQASDDSQGPVFQIPPLLLRKFPSPTPTWFIHFQYQIQP